ncbi:MAG: SRPBCC domain-containing protein [Burkholderiales bacterium]|nr:SRPBCC domain-containing protein [Burkholderiales bacterium]
MTLALAFDTRASIEQVRDTLGDLDRLVACLPGARLTGVASPGHIPLQFDLRVGPLPVTFVGSAQVRFEASGRTGRVVAQAVERFTGVGVEADARFVLRTQDDGATTVAIEVDHHLRGTPSAALPSGVITELARGLGKAFADRFRAQLAGRPDLRLPPAPPVDGLALMRAAVGRRLRHALSGASRVTAPASTPPRDR